MGYKDSAKQKEFQKKHYLENKSKYTQRIKDRIKENGDYISLIRSKGCVICGYNKCEEALDFHHLDEKIKDRNISKAKRDFCLKTLKEEIEKCIVVCANCHREIHAGLIIP